MNNNETLESLFKESCGKTLSKHECYEVRGERGVFSNALVVWLGIQQRLGQRSQSGAMLEYAAHLEKHGPGVFISRASRKHREGELSTNSGGLSRARERLPEELCQELFFESAKNIEAHFKRLGHRKSDTYLLDGLVLTVAHTRATQQEYGLVRNRQRALHYPRIRCVAAHRLDTGVCRALQIGNYTDHETTLARSVIEQLPKGCTVVMDRGFATPALVQHATTRGIKVVVRLKDDTGKKLLALQQKQMHNSASSVLWCGRVKKQQQEPPKVAGRVAYIRNQIPGFRSSEFYLFTTTPLQDELLAELYLQRVQIETAIRHVKQTLNLCFVNSKKPESIRKEVLIAYIAYNLIRAIMEDSALALGMPVTRISFTASVTLTEVYARLLLNTTKAQCSEIIARFRKRMREQLLPNRKSRRSYPRHVKMPTDKYTRSPTVPLHPTSSHSLTGERK